MGRPLSNDLRTRIEAHIAAGHSMRDAARRFNVSASFVIKLGKKIKETGSIIPVKQGRPPGKGKIACVLGTILDWIQKKPDTTMMELSSRLENEQSIKVTPRSISRALKRAGMTYKKKR